MKRTINNIMALSFCLICIFLISAMVQAAVPTVEDITISPTEPMLLSTVTFNATISVDETLEDVRIIVQECNQELCFRDYFNESMTLLAPGLYQATVTLILDDATYIKYHAKLKGIEGGSESEIISLNLSTEP